MAALEDFGSKDWTGNGLLIINIGVLLTSLHTFPAISLSWISSSRLLASNSLDSNLQPQSENAKMAIQQDARPLSIRFADSIPTKTQPSTAGGGLFEKEIDHDVDLEETAKKITEQDLNQKKKQV